MAHDDNEQDYQDPILTPGKLKKIVQSLPGNIKSQHMDYNYHRATSIFKNELDELFDYTEVTIHLQEYRRLYEQKYEQTQPIKGIVVALLDKLESSNQDIRIQTCKHLVHLSVRTTTASKENEIIQNNQLLLSCGVFSNVHQKLQLSFKEYHNNDAKNQLGICTEIDLYLTLLYLLLETQRLEENLGFKDELMTYSPDLVQLLFSSIAKTREKIDPNFPIKKSILLLWKSLLFISGGLDNIKSQADHLRKSLGLDNSKNIVTKCTPEDYLMFQNEIIQKYPGFCPNDLPISVSSPLTITTTRSLAKAMGYSTATEKTELFYQSLFPPKSTSSLKKHHHLLQEYFPENDIAAFPLPLQHTGSDVPKNIQEANDVFIRNMCISSGTFQMIQEKSKAIHKWQTTPSSESENESLIDTIYSNMMPDLQSFIMVILKLLLVSVANNQHIEADEPITLEYLEHQDVCRNKEILSKAISGTLLVLLKWTKSSHILKFEYISQLLVDSGCLLLILKMIGLQEVSELVKSRTDVPYYGFFDYDMHRSLPPEKPDNKSEPATNSRNMYWIINLLRVLQLLTKNKSHRTMLMVQYKSAAILKRVLKVAHPFIELYALKLLKSQVPYLGKKWRSQNMKIVSSIYLNCKTVLKDDWVSRVDSNEDEEIGKMKEKVMRVLIQIYNNEKYNFPLPIHDEMSSIEEPSGPGYYGWVNYDLHTTTNKSVESDSEFIDSYEDWLETKVSEQSEIYDYDVTPVPYPMDHPTFTPEELYTEINRLYVNELNSEFKASIKPTEAKENEQWNPTSISKKLTPLPRYNGTEVTYVRPTQFRDEQNIEALQDEILARLMEVEEKVAEKWFHKMCIKSDKNHYKMLDFYAEEENLSA